MPDKQDPKNLRIMELVVQYVKRIKVVRIKPRRDRHLIEIAGDNGQGKSSLLDGLALCLLGPGNMKEGQKIGMPVRIGEAQAQIDIDLGEYKVTRYIYPNGKTKLVLKDAKGNQIAAGQDVIDTLVKNLSFDPLHFAGMSEKERKNEIRTITGLDLNKFDADTNVLMTTRTMEGRPIETLKSRLKGMPEADPTLPAKPIDTEKLLRRMQEAEQHNRDVDTKARAIEEKYAEADGQDKAAADALKRISELEKEIIALRKTSKDATADAKKVRIQADKLKKAIPAKLEIVAIGRELSEANETNRKLERAQERKNVESQLANQEKLYNDLTAQITKRKSEREEMIRNAHMPIKGLSIGDDDVLYNNVPFSQISRGEQVKVSVYIAMALNPTIRTLRIKDGAALDKKNLKLIEEIATEHDYQVFIERVEPSDEHAIIIENGEAISGDDIVRSQAQ